MTSGTFNASLTIGGVLSLVASALHIGIIFGGGKWYRFFGAGEQFARAAEGGASWPAFITLGIAAVLFTWAMYGFSGSGLVPALPLLKPGLILIASIYLLRGLAIVPLYVFARTAATPFMLWSSLICIGFGLAYAIGIVQTWNN